MPLPELRRFRVVENRPEAERTFTLVLEPADGKPMFEFKAGQWVMLHLLNEDGTTWAKAAFSIATAPYESKERIELGIKIYGEYTQRAAKLAAGEEVALQGPYGVFVLPSGNEPLVLLAAGIGVTPLRSMLRESVKIAPERPIYLFYSDKTRRDMAYEKELREMQALYPAFQPILSLTRESAADWKGEEGRVDISRIQRHVADCTNAVYVMCGPDAFMSELRDGLATIGVDVKNRVKKELFG